MLDGRAANLLRARRRRYTNVYRRKSLKGVRVPVVLVVGANGGGGGGSGGGDGDSNFPVVPEADTRCRVPCHTPRSSEVGRFSPQILLRPFPLDLHQILINASK